MNEIKLLLEKIFKVLKNKNFETSKFELNSFNTYKKYECFIAHNDVITCMKIYFNEDGETVITIWVKGPLRSKGCKKDLTLENRLIEKFEQYMPYYKHKMFSKVLVNYIYDKFGIKCDCVQYDYDFGEVKYVDDDGDEYEYYTSKTRKYNVKKKKKI